MTLRRSKRACGLIALGLVMFTGQPVEGWAALTYDFTLGAGVQRNDNLYLDPKPSDAEGAGGEEGLREPVEVTIFTVNPGAVISWDAERDQLRLRYHGEYSHYRGDEEPDPLWVHTIAANLSWRRWAPFFLEAGEERARIPRSQDQDIEASVDQVDRNRATVRTGLVADFGPRSTVEIAYRGELETYAEDGSTDEADEADDGADELDRVQRQYAEAMVRHRWSPLWGSEVRAAYGLVAREIASDYAEFRVSADVDQRWSEQITSHYRLEWRREEDDEPAEADETGESPDTVRANLLLGVAISGTLEFGGSWNLAYQDGLQDLVDGDTLETGRTSAAVALRARGGSSLDVGGWYETRDYRVSGRAETAWGPTFAARWLMAPWAALDVGAGWTRTTIQEEALEEVRDRTSRVSAGVVLLALERVQVEAGYGFRKNDSADALRSYTNNIVFALVTFHFRPVGPGRLPPSYAAGLVGGGAPSGGTPPAAQRNGAADPVR